MNFLLWNSPQIQKQLVITITFTPLLYQRAQLSRQVNITAARLIAEFLPVASIVGPSSDTKARQRSFQLSSSLTSYVILEERISVEKMPSLRLASRQVCGIFSWLMVDFGHPSLLWVGPTPGKVVLGSIGKEVEQALGSKPVSDISPWPLPQSMPPGCFCLRFLC